MRRLVFFAALLSLVFLYSLETSAIDFTAHGYYRTRAKVNYDLDTQGKHGNPTHDNNRSGLIAYNQMRLRLQPVLKLNDFLSIHASFDFLDNLLFGTHDTKELYVLSPIVGTFALPAGAGSLSLVGGAAGENGSINVRRVWGEVLTPIGKLRVGRQPSNWGLGIFQNDGNGRQADFGDTADRILFITQKQFNNGGALSAGVLWDIPYEAQYDPRIQGFGGAIRDNGQDTHQYAGIIYYEAPSFTAAFFGGVRRRNGGKGTTTTAYAIDTSSSTGLTPEPVAAGIDGNTLMYFFDVYGRYKYREYSFKLEYVYLGGKISTGVAIDAIPFSGFNPNPGSTANGVIQLPADQDIRINMAAFEAKARYKWGGEWNLKAGFAQGDATPLSQRVTQYGFRPDYQIALILFNLPLGTSPAMIDPNNGRLLAGNVPITGNYINNAIYVSGTYKHHFDFGAACKQCNDFSVGARVTTAFPHKNPVELDFRDILNDPSLPAIEQKSTWYGIEADLIVEGLFYDHLYAALEGGVFIPGDVFDINVDLIDPTGTMVAPISPDKAQIAWATRITLMWNF